MTTVTKTICDVCGSDYDEITLDANTNIQRKSDMKAFDALGYEDVCRNCRLKLKKILYKALRELEKKSLKKKKERLG